MLLDARPEPSDEGFEPLEPRVDALPAGGDQVDEQREVVETRVAVGECSSLERVEAAEHLVHQTADLREVSPDRENLLAQPVLNGVLHALGKVRRGRLGSFGERFELRACAVEDGVQRGSVGASLDALLRALDRGVVYARQR